MMFSGALQAYYYHTHGNDALVGKPATGKKDAASDADDEEEPEWNPPQKGTKRGLRATLDGEPPSRTAADDEYEQENNFDDIDSMVKTAQLKGQELSNSLSVAEEAERTRLNSAASSSGGGQIDFAATGRSASAYSAKSAVSSVSGPPATPATPSTAATQQQAQTPMTPFSTLEVTGTGSQMNQVVDFPAHDICTISLLLKHKDPLQRMRTESAVPVRFGRQEPRI